MRDFIIKALGGITSKEHVSDIEKLKSDCEVFAVKHMNPKGTSPLMDKYPLTNSDITGNIVMYVSGTSSVNCTADGLVVAPWCRNTSTYGLHIRQQK